MKLKSLFLFLAASLGFSQAVQAYFVAVPKSQQALTADRPVHILVSGKGTDLGDQPQLSALSRAILYQRNFPNDQVVLISVFENKYNEAQLVDSGWKFVEKNEEKLGTKVVNKESFKFSQIKSFEFFGHNSPSLGTQADGLGHRYDFRDPEVATLASHFTKDAYATIHGCNSGWILAQDLSKTWGIPVAGSFTGTRFEHLHSDGHFYVFVPQKTPNLNWAKSNPDLGLKCSTGACMRMRPAYSHYNGKWGDFQGPLLHHYKFFCQKEEKECQKVMALSLYGFLAEKSLTRDSTMSEFRKVAQEYLCPVYKDRKITEDCIRELEQMEHSNGNLNVSFVVGDKQLSCDMQSCSGKMTCDNHICKVSGRVSKNSDTMAQEYLHLLNGFRTLQKEGL